MKKSFKIAVIIALVLTMSLLLTAQTKKDIIVVDGEGNTENRDERIAIIVGVDNYATINDLEYAVADARIMKNVLEEYGNFKVKYFADDPKEPNAIEPQKDYIEQAIKSANDAARYGWVKTLVFYFSGHGFEDEADHYLATLGTHRKFLKETAISVNKLKEDMLDIKKNAKVIMFIDACRTDIQGTDVKKRNAEDVWEKDIDAKGLTMIRSTTKGQPSYELGGLGHGVFTYYTVEGLKGEADRDQDGFVTFHEVSRYVWTKMDEWSTSNPNKLQQAPRIHIDEQSGVFNITAAGKFQPRPRIHPDLESVSYRDMVYVDGGTFTQITDETDDSGGFRHTISSFEIGKYEVTYELWYTVYQWATDNGYKFANEGREGHNGTDGAKPTSSKYEPVTVVNWRDTIVWCNAYSEMCNKSPVYLNSSGKVIKDSRNSNGDECDSAEPDWDADGYRLPTEGEWQFAASDRGDTPYDYASGASDDYENSSATKKVAWYGSNSDGKTHDVGTKRANDLGLYDMSGNVWEWCWDWYDDLPTSSATDYRNSTAGSFRVLRGGSWYYFAKNLQVGYRNYITPSFEDYDVGFRLARQLP